MQRNFTHVEEGERSLGKKKSQTPDDFDGKLHGDRAERLADLVALRLCEASSAP